MEPPHSLSQPASQPATPLLLSSCARYEPSPHPAMLRSTNTHYACNLRGMESWMAGLQEIWLKTGSVDAHPPNLLPSSISAAPRLFLSLPLTPISNTRSTSSTASPPPPPPLPLMWCKTLEEMSVTTKPPWCDGREMARRRWRRSELS